MIKGEKESVSGSSPSLFLLPFLFWVEDCIAALVLKEKEVYVSNVAPFMSRYLFSCI